VPRICFAADRMLGRLARMLRLLGYDTLYSPAIAAPDLQAIARAGGRVILTRGRLETRFPQAENVLSLTSDNAAEQLRQVVRLFGLDTHSGLWTRCTLCNAPIAGVDKAEIQSEVEPRIFHLYDKFHRCSGCGRVYWRGSHVERILRNLDLILRASDHNTAGHSQ
jgi:uncharacterized protein